MADAAAREGRITGDERVTWGVALRGLADDGDFLYGIVCHAISGVSRCDSVEVAPVAGAC